MNKLKFIVVSVVSLGLIGIVAFFVIGLLRPRAAGILIETNPAAAVFINGEQVGNTPYKDTRQPGDSIIKLIPDSYETPLAPYETKVTLVSGVETIIRRDFAETEDRSSGEIVSFEPNGSKEAGVAIISIPNSTNILIDNVDKAVTPYKTNNIIPGEHNVTISAPGYTQREFTIRVYANYNLTAVVYLGKSDNEVSEEQQNEETTQVVEEKPSIEILATPVGYLRVRQLPTISAEEVGRVNPGDIFEILEEDEKTGWYKIEYKEGKEGWVTNEYARKKNVALATPTTSP